MTAMASPELSLLERLERSHVLRFQPLRSSHFLDDEGQGDVIIYYGQVVCPGCHHTVEVGASSESEDVGYCPFPRCGTRITAAVDPDHLRLDDSRPLSTELGCECGDPECLVWEAV
jgi:hypothetical protein